MCGPHVVCGSMEEKPASNFEWVINNIFQFDFAERKQFQSPPFFVRNTPLVLVCRLNDSPIPKEVRICLGRPTKDLLLELTHLSINLIAEDGSEHQVCLKRDVTFSPNSCFMDATFIGADGRFSISELQTKFLPNGSLRIRCQVSISLIIFPGKTMRTGNFRLRMSTC